MLNTSDLQRTAEALVDEVAEYYLPFEKLRQTLKTGRGELRPIRIL
jgi:hypothetical protein